MFKQALYFNGSSFYFGKNCTKWHLEELKLLEKLPYLEIKSTLLSSILIRNPENIKQKVITRKSRRHSFTLEEQNYVIEACKEQIIPDFPKLSKHLKKPMDKCLLYFNTIVSPSNKKGVPFTKDEDLLLTKFLEFKTNSYYIARLLNRPTYQVCSRVKMVSNNKNKKNAWTQEEICLLSDACFKSPLNWQKVSESVKTKSIKECMAKFVPGRIKMQASEAPITTEEKILYYKLKSIALQKQKMCMFFPGRKYKFVKKSISPNNKKMPNRTVLVDSFIEHGAKFDIIRSKMNVVLKNEELLQFYKNVYERKAFSNIQEIIYLAFKERYEEEKLNGKINYRGCP